jgi:hypothetical protein
MMTVICKSASPNVGHRTLIGLDYFIINHISPRPVFPTCTVRYALRDCNVAAVILVHKFTCPIRMLDDHMSLLHSTNITQGQGCKDNLLI